MGDTHKRDAAQRAAEHRYPHNDDGGYCYVRQAAFAEGYREHQSRVKRARKAHKRKAKHK